MAALLAVALLVGRVVAAAQAAPQSGTGMTALVQLYETDRGGVARFYELPWSGVRFDRLEKLNREWRERRRGLDFSALQQQERIDSLLLRNEIEAALNRLALERRWLAEMKDLLSFAEEIQRLEQERWTNRPMTPPECATKIAALPDLVKKLRERLEAGRKEKDKKADDATNHSPEIAALKVSPVVAKRAAEATLEIRGTLRRWFEFYDGFQPDFSWWVKKPFEEANRALEDYAKFLREEIAGLKGKDEDPLLGEAIGPAVLEQALAGEMIAYTPEQLLAIGEREFAWCEEQMKIAARELGFGDGWRKALDRVKSAYAPPGGQDDVVADCAREAIGFVTARDLVSVPPLCEETWRITMLSPEAQKTMPYAAYGGQSMLVAYAREDMKHADKLMAMRGNNRHFMRIVTAHELIPGHHLQAFSAARHRPYRQVFSTPFYVEGWPLYWEMKLWDLGYLKTPEDRIGALFWRMHRSARILVSLKFHLGRMQPAAMVDFLVDRVGHERLGATSEVRRYIGSGYSPLYQCGYMIGGLQLRALHQEVVGAGKMSEREFNDQVLSYGPVPIEMIRAGMLNLPLGAETTAAWKFAGEITARGDETSKP